MSILFTQILTSKSMQYIIDLPINFMTNSFLLRVLNGVLAKRCLCITKNISIEDLKSLQVSSYLFKGKLNFEKWRVPVKFKIYNKQLDLAQLSRQKDSSIPEITRFEFTILSSRYLFSEGILDKYKRLYHSFLCPIDLNELIVFEEIISFQLYKNFCEKKLKAPDLQIKYFILQNSKFFMTTGILKRFYQLLFENKFVESPLRKFYSQFKKTNNFANLRFSTLEELNNLINSLRLQLS